MFRNRKQSYSASVMLLLIYLLSISPTILFHHHDHNSKFQATADSTGNSFEYNNFREAKIGEALETCLLCENHTHWPHMAELEIASHLILGIGRDYTNLPYTYAFTFQAQSLNKGPPFV